MAYLPQSHGQVRRAPRTRFSEATPAVLRFTDGRCVPGKLQTISVTGGLLCLTQAMNKGAVVKLMFLTRKGAVFGEAEMLTPVSWELQPFRFLELHNDDQYRLQAAIQSSLEQNHREHKETKRGFGQMETHRAW